MSSGWVFAKLWDYVFVHDVARSVVDKDVTGVNTSSSLIGASSPESEYVQLHYCPTGRRLQEKHETTCPFSSHPRSEGLTGQTLYKSRCTDILFGAYLW